MPILINREDVVTFILGDLSPIFWNASVLRIFVPGFEEDRPKDSENDLEWRMHEVCGAMFGEERVNNSFDLLFSWSNLSVSYSYTLLLQLAVTDSWMLLKLQSRTARLLFFRDEPTLRRFCTHCGPMFSSVRERAVSCESCNPIGSRSGQNFPTSDHGPGNRAKTMNENSNTAKLGWTRKVFCRFLATRCEFFVNSQFSHVL